jgi:hypothetical protein
VRPEHEWRARSLHGKWPVGCILERVILPLECRQILPQVAIDQIQRFGIAVDKLAGWREFETEHFMFGQVPTSANAEFEPSPGDVVDRDRLFRQDCRVAEGVAAD